MEEINEINILKAFIEKVRKSDRSSSKNINLSIDEARNICYALSAILLDKLKPSNDNSNFDGGTF